MVWLHNEKIWSWGVIRGQEVTSLTQEHRNMCYNSLWQPCSLQQKYPELQVEQKQQPYALYLSSCWWWSFIYQRLHPQNYILCLRGWGWGGSVQTVLPPLTGFFCTWCASHSAAYLRFPPKYHPVFLYVINANWPTELKQRQHFPCRSLWIQSKWRSSQRFTKKSTWHKWSVTIAHPFIAVSFPASSANTGWLCLTLGPAFHVTSTSLASLHERKGSTKCPSFILWSRPTLHQFFRFSSLLITVFNPAHQFSSYYGNAKVHLALHKNDIKQTGS